VADFEALNKLRSQTLRQIREMVSEEAAFWARYFNGQNSAELVAGIEANRARFRALWEQHERIRQAMTEAGFIPPAVQSEDSPVYDPTRHRIEERLRSEVESARAEYYLASQEFRFFTAQGTGLPAPDRNLRAKQIVASHSSALHKYTSAIRRFNAFLADGKLPGE
jgi:hypothetical protein